MYLQGVFLAWVFIFYSTDVSVLDRLVLCYCLPAGFRMSAARVPSTGLRGSDDEDERDPHSRAGRKRDRVLAAQMQAEENNKRLRGKASTSVLTAAASSSSSSSYSATSSIFESESRHGTYYIQCCNCRKLRPIAWWVEIADFPCAWSCELNDWDPSFATCSSAEDLTENVIEINREEVL